MKSLIPSHYQRANVDKVNKEPKRFLNVPPDVDERKGEDFSHEIFIFICYCPPKLHNFFQNYFACPPGHFVVLTHRIMSIQDIGLKLIPNYIHMMAIKKRFCNRTEAPNKTKLLN